METDIAKPAVNLTPEQKKAINWMDGAMLVLAGPGAGKTRVLTHRVARLLRKSQHEGYHVLALTFTNRAAAEMANRVKAFVPEDASRTFIGTFHSFCTQILRTHGLHLGIQSSFEVVARPDDRIALLKEALARHNLPLTQYEGSRLLKLIDRLKSHLIGSEQAEEFLVRKNGLKSSKAASHAADYKLYDQVLRQHQVLDFNSIIFEAWRLFEHEAFVRHYQEIYPYWLVDEFQDTNYAQFALLKRMAGADFRNIFVVADLDQTIFEWNGAWVKRIYQFKAAFSSEEVHLSKNFRCPPAIIEAGNELLRNNSIRGVKMQPTTAANHHWTGPPRSEQLRIKECPTDQKEFQWIASQIESLAPATREKTVVIARARWPLVQLKEELDKRSVQAVVVRHREFFEVPELRWLIACLKQVRRPLDQLNMKTLVDAYNRFMEAEIDLERVRFYSESEQITLLSAWLDMTEDTSTRGSDRKMVALVRKINQGGTAWRKQIQDIIWYLEGRANRSSDLEDELKDWHSFVAQASSSTIDHFLQELSLASKVQGKLRDTVQLMTIHGSKGTEFERVFLIGMADGILPSKHGFAPPDKLEEERRACYVAMTRASQQLTISYALQYGGQLKKPSRFLQQMGAAATR